MGFKRFPIELFLGLLQIRYISFIPRDFGEYYVPIVSLFEGVMGIVYGIQFLLLEFEADSDILPHLLSLFDSISDLKLSLGILKCEFRFFLL